MLTELKHVFIEGKKFHYTLSFDIDDFIGDGVWWLQIYDSNRNLRYDKPFASSFSMINKKKIRKIIKDELLTLKGELL